MISNILSNTGTYKFKKELISGNKILHKAVSVALKTLSSTYYLNSKSSFANKCQLNKTTIKQDKIIVPFEVAKKTAAMMVAY